jgi:hypothetical protein
MRNATAIATLAAVCGLAGCGPRPADAPPGADAGFGAGWSWYAVDAPNGGTANVSVTVAWGSWKKKLVYVVGADAAASATTRTATTGAGTEYTVDLSWPDGRTASVRIETPDGSTGRAVFAGRSDDLADGAVFALVPAGDRFELRQLRRDVSGVAADLGSVQKLIRDDQDLLSMFARVK